MGGYRCEILQLDGVDNARDLGGYPGAGGRPVRHRRFLRTASLSGLTDKGLGEMKALGVDCVVDLRSRTEVQKAPDGIPSHAGIRQEHIPLLDYIQSNILAGDFSAFPKSMAEMYIGLLERSKKDIQRLFSVFAGPEQTCLFHCTAGKDRTGVATMLLLDLAGVSEADIVEDYAYSQSLIPSMPRLPFVPGYLLESRPSTMEAALEHLRSRYGDAESYLNAAGVSGAEIRRIREKLLEDA